MIGQVCAGESMLKIYSFILHTSAFVTFPVIYWVRRHEWLRGASVWITSKLQRVLEQRWRVRRCDQEEGQEEAMTAIWNALLPLDVVNLKHADAWTRTAEASYQLRLKCRKHFWHRARTADFAPHLLQCRGFGKGVTWRPVWTGGMTLSTYIQHVSVVLS